MFLRKTPVSLYKSWARFSRKEFTSNGNESKIKQKGIQYKLIRMDEQKIAVIRKWCQKFSDIIRFGYSWKHALNTSMIYSKRNSKPEYVCHVCFVNRSRNVYFLGRGRFFSFLGIGKFFHSRNKKEVKYNVFSCFWWWAFPLLFSSSLG